MSLYARTAASAFEPVGQLSGQVFYETSLAQVCTEYLAHKIYSHRMSVVRKEACKKTWG